MRWQLAALVLSTLIGLLLTAQAEPAHPADMPSPDGLSPARPSGERAPV